MTEQNPKPVAPSIASLTARFLESRSDESVSASDMGLAVELHEAPSGFRTDIRTTWGEALVAAGLTGISPPSGWATLCMSTPQRYAICLCVGNFPQMLGDVGKLASCNSLSELTTADSQPYEPISVRLGDPARKCHPELARLLAVTELRLAGELDAATAALADAEVHFVGKWRLIWENERAALMWERGDHNAAIASWEKLPQSSVRSFNLGMAALFMNQNAIAKLRLAEACEQLPDSSGWKHLALLYSAICDSRGAS